jgi:hypothetical protein
MAILTWAERELELAGHKADDTEDGPNKWMREGTLELLRVFCAQGHSGGSAPYAVDLFQRLASWKPLTQLTGEESEWGTEASPDQNNRFSAVFRDTDGNAHWSGGIVFWEWYEGEDGERHKSYFTTKGSSVPIEFPFTVPDKPEYREADTS